MPRAIFVPYDDDTMGEEDWDLGVLEVMEDAQADPFSRPYWTGVSLRDAYRRYLLLRAELQACFSGTACWKPVSKCLSLADFEADLLRYRSLMDPAVPLCPKQAAELSRIVDALLLPYEEIAYERDKGDETVRAEP